MSAKPVLYYIMPSPPCRAVLLTAAAIGIDLKLEEVNLLEAEHLKPEFVKVSTFMAINFFFLLHLDLNE